MTNKATSWKIIRDQKRKENFVGRGEPIRIFIENFSAEIPEFMVFSITGEGGVGKSTLLGRIEHIASTNPYNAKVIICDDKQTAPVLAMGFISEKLKENGISHKEFDERYKKYGELRQELEGDPKVPRSATNLIARGVTDFTIKSLKKTPGVGVFFEYADEKAAGDALAELMQYSISKWGNKDEVKLLREPELILTPLFLELIKKAYTDQRVLLMFDVFERTSDSLAPWLLNLFKFEYGEYDTRLLFVISGREPLEQHWTELAGLIQHVSLEPFSLEETKLYLNNQDITDENLVSQIYEDTGGLPVLVELLAATKPQAGMPLPDISKDAIERFLQWTLDEDKRRVAILAAVPRQFNLDILSVVLGKDAIDLFTWLSSQSFVRTDSERGFFYHEKVRDLMVRYLKNMSPSELLTSHHKLAEFFALENSRLNLKDADAYDNLLWRNIEIEYLYHSVMKEVHHRETLLLNAYLQAFRWKRQFSTQIAHLSHQIGHETLSKSIEKLSSTLVELVDAYEQDNYEKVIEILNLFSKRDDLTPIAKSKLYSLRGRVNYMINKNEEAIKDLSQAIELEPENSDAMGFLGAAFYAMGKHEEAIKSFNKTVEFEPNTAWLFGVRGIIYFSMEKYEEAIKSFDRAIELNLKDGGLFLFRGKTHIFMKKYGEAIKDLDQAIELEPKNALFFSHRGVAFLALDKDEEALKDFDQAIELDPNVSTPFSLRGMIYQSLDKYEEALKDFDQAIELEQKNALYFFYRGMAFQSLGKYEEALKDFDQAIELEPKRPSFYSERGSQYLIMDKIEEAIKDLDQAIELDPKDGRAFGVRGFAYQSLEKYDEAIKDFTQAIEFNPKSGWLFSNRGEAYRLFGKHEEAIKDFDQAIEIDPKDALSYSSRGEAYQSLGKYEEAIKDFDRTIELNPEYTWVIAYRGLAYRSMGKYEEAIKSFSEAIATDPNDDWWHYERSLCYLMKNEKNEALKDLGLAMEQAEMEYKLSPNNWSNTFNLALYYLAVAKYKKSEQLYSAVLKEDLPMDLKNTAIGNLDEFIYLFPKNQHAKAMRKLFK